MLASRRLRGQALAPAPRQPSTKRLNRLAPTEAAKYGCYLRRYGHRHCSTWRRKTASTRNTMETNTKGSYIRHNYRNGHSGHDMRGRPPQRLPSGDLPLVLNILPYN